MPSDQLPFQFGWLGSVGWIKYFISRNFRVSNNLIRGGYISYENINKRHDSYRYEIPRQNSNEQKIFTKQNFK